MARPRIKIDVEQLEKCAEKQWSVAEIAAFFRVSHDTIERRYALIIKEARARGTAKLRDLLWQRAINGSDRILENIADRFIGPRPQRMEITREQAIEKLETDLKSRGIDIDQIASGPKDRET